MEKTFLTTPLARGITIALTSSIMLAACVVEPARPPRPAPVMEVVPAAPAPSYHWVKGHYRWENNHWQWVPGHWAPNA